MNRRLARLADISYRHRGKMVLGWIVAMIVIIGVGSSLAGDFNANYDTPGSDSKAASDITKSRFDGYSGQEIYAVAKNPSGFANTAEAAQRLQPFFAQAEKVEHIDPHTQIRLSQNRQIASTTLPMTVPGWEMTKDQGKQLINAAQDNDGNGLEIKLGGDPIYAAQSQSSPEGLGFLGAAIVLLIAFGSVVAAGLPLAIALVGLGISSAGLIPLLANGIDVPDWTTAVSGLIGIGVGIDYALLVLTRFRSALADGKDRHDAVVEAVTTAGRSVIIAGLTVVVAVLGLMLTGLSYMYGVAISTGLAVLTVMLASISLLPALLSYLGPRVDKLRIPLLGRALRPTNGTSPAARWSHMVQRRPWPFAVGALVLLLALAAPALGMRLGFPDAGNDPPDTMTRQAYDLNTEGFGPGSNGPVVVAATFDSPSDRGTIDQLANDIRSDQDVAYVAAPRINQAQDAAIVTVIPKSSPQDQTTENLVHRLRDNTIPGAVGGKPIDVKVGGVTAALEDQSTYMTDRMPLFIAGVVGLSFLLLLVAFHSPLISLKAALMNLLSVSAGYGVMTLAANGGGLSNLIGIDHEVPIAPFMPVMMFAILFGLSMDYEVFLISRIREEYLKDRNTSRAVADGLAKTARVITAAAAIMVVVFLAFLAAQDVFLKLFGIGLAAAILLDATVVRMILVPAVMQLLGKWNWWIPSWLENKLPSLDVERVAPAGAESR